MFAVNFKVLSDTQKFTNAINKIELLEMDLRKQMATDTEKTAIEFVREARTNAHVITGNMRNSITYRSASEGAVTVSADIDYAVYENARGPPHDFFDQAVNTMDSKFRSIIQNGVKAVIDNTNRII